MNLVYEGQQIFTTITNNLFTNVKKWILYESSFLEISVRKVRIL